MGSEACLKVLLVMHQHTGCLNSIGLPASFIWTTGATYGIAFLLYLLLVRCLRWRRYAAIHKKFEAKFRTGNLTIQDAQEIVHTSALWDMPELLYIALSYATIKTFAIPSISKILLSTKQMSSAEHASRRYAGTGILTYTWIGCPILGREFSSGRERSDPRSMIATGRVNWLHSKYRIANDDYLYTLSLYVLEYLRWTDEHGWRQLSEMERQALLMFWSEMGRRLEIQGIPETLNDLKTWAKCYEEEHRCQAKSNFDIMSFTIDYNSRVYPRLFGMRNLHKSVVKCVLEYPVQAATMMSMPPWYMYVFTNGLLYGMKYYHRYLALPRRHPSSVVALELPDGSDRVRMHPTTFGTKPWYKPEGRGLNWAIDHLLLWAGYREGIPGRQFKSEGYRLEEIGPQHYEHLGHKEVMETAEGIYGSPIGAPWRIDRDDQGL
ncbi:ER-bound oxygenase mpaB/B' [Pleurotus pulmonarius]